VNTVSLSVDRQQHSVDRQQHSSDLVFQFCLNVVYSLRLCSIIIQSDHMQHLSSFQTSAYSLTLSLSLGSFTRYSAPV